VNIEQSVIPENADVENLTVQLKSYYPVVLQVLSHVDQAITLAFPEHYPTLQKAAAASLKQLRDLFHGQKYCRPSKVPSVYESLHQPALTYAALLAE
jgi:hypothetical protein